MPLAEFVLLTTLGCAIWATGFVLIGFAAGNAWTAIDSVVGKVLLGVGLVVLIATFGHRQNAIRALPMGECARSRGVWRDGWYHMNVW